MALKLGIFAVPDATDPAATVAQIVAADRSGLDFAGIQDHPYQRRFLDTWTLLAFVAARTERLRLLTDVANLPLRPPALLAQAAASLDLLSGGRFELGIGAGAFWEAVAALGGPRRSPRESVDALEEAITIIRAAWAGERSTSFAGEHYRVTGAHIGPVPARPIGIWIGAYGPRMLRLTGRLGDGFLPSLGCGHYLDPADAPRLQRAIDEAARAAGRDPAAIERAANVMALVGAPATWSDQLARIATELRFTTLLVAVPDGEEPVAFTRRLGEDVAPRARELAG
jgi:alkanesulfonate monooxygenase SsuD/methylene tetrahydromethanopterin reductase-like flavin-dependent oxidoreductase (luciferase family)